MRIDLDNYQDIEKDKSFDYGGSRKKRGGNRFLRFVLSFILSIIIVGLIGYATIKFFVGPIIKTVDGLPMDFPTELSLYNIDEATIDMQNPEGRQKVINGMRAMPDWVLNLFLNTLSDDLKGRLAKNFGSEINVPQNFSVDDLKSALENVGLENSKTINLSWDSVDKTKEEVAAFYKQKLSEADFEFKENLKDYEINLGFWKDDVFGMMSFSDDDKKTDSGYNSDVDITVNYFNNQ